jgi:conjugative transposon TraK protein
MFRKAKNIDTAFKQTRMLALIVVVSALILCCFVVYTAYETIRSGQEKIYVLGNGKALEAFSTSRKDNILIEAKEHIKDFHTYFFTLSPDDRHIRSNITKALYLADNSAKKQYDNLKEKNYYTGIVSGNVSQELFTDSISIDLQTVPYSFIFYGRQEITRPTSIVVRNLICEGVLREMNRSENNPHGFLIERWKILENKDRSIKNR